MATCNDVAMIAREAGERGDRGNEWHGPFNLRATGWCTRFVRQCHEAALGFPPHTWEFRSAHARELEDKLTAAGKRTRNWVPGDIVCINGGTGRFGHVGIYLGNGEFAENTSSSRGPGTTISQISQVQNRITGYYHVLPVAEEEPVAPFYLVSAWAQPAVAWMLDEGLLHGEPGRPIDGGEAVTVERFAVMLKRYDDYNRGEVD